MREEATARSVAALAALRGQVSPEQIQKLVRKQQRRARAGRVFKGVAVIGALAGGAFAAWKWWDKQANPDWLVEPPAATEVSEPERLSSVGGSDESVLDPEVEAKQAEDEAANRDDRR
jgi:serine-rich repeat adhesion-like glycoprotein